MRNAHPTMSMYAIPVPSRTYASREYEIGREAKSTTAKKIRMIFTTLSLVVLTIVGTNADARCTAALPWRTFMPNSQKI
jgi:hypothetical protein